MTGGQARLAISNNKPGIQPRVGYVHQLHLTLNYR